MSISSKTEKALEALGLTGYEIKAYTTLISTGPMTAVETSRQSGVPYSKVYDVLNNLEVKGWVEAEHSRPSKFFPKSPNTAIDTLKMRLERSRIQNENQVLSELLPIFEKRGVKEKPDIWIVRGDFNILTKVKETLEGCSAELMLAVPPAIESLIDIASPIVFSLKGKGVKISIMTHGSTSPTAVRAMSKWGDVKMREAMFGGGVISDAREVILLLAGGDGAGGSLAIWADHPGLAGLAKNYYDYLWDDSKVYA
ncbi:MAG: helix-turn-helix domain-containing protein [Nitrososphaerales archaeon]